MREKYDVFISYRREGGLKDAMLLKTSLEERGYHVYLDMVSMQAGEFDQQLYDRIEECKDFLVVLPPRALDRCSEEEDWVRIEIEHAYAKQKNIIPIMLDDFSFPEELPESIEFIRLRHGLRPSFDYYDAFIDKLAKYLKSKPEIKSIEEENQRIKKGKQKRKTGWLIVIGVLVVAVVTAVMWLRPDPSSGEVRESRTGRPGGIRDRCGDLIAGRERDRRCRYHRPGGRIRRPEKFANREPGALVAVVVV